MKKRATPLIVAGVMAVSAFFTGYTYQDGMGHVYYESQRQLADSTYITEQLAGHPENGIEHAYIVSSDTGSSTIQPFVFNGEVTGKYTLTNMIKWIEEAGFKVVAGINGDLYDTGSGAPKGPIIHDYKLKTSGYAPGIVVAFDGEGKAYTAYGGYLGYAVRGTIDEPVSTEPVEGEEAEITYNRREMAINIDYFNVPHGAANGLHLFNRQYAATTKTSGSCVEVLLEAGSVANAELQVGQTVKATVVSTNPSGNSTAMTESQLVLSAKVGSASAYPISLLVPGTEVEITVADSSNGLNNAKEAIGVYEPIAENGQVTATSNSLQPRTAIGIKADGTVLLYVVDGRQTAKSQGLGLIDVAKHLLAQGCVTVLNMDGGGSTTMAVRYPGIQATAAVANSPSEGSLRAVTNGLFFVYPAGNGGGAANLHIYSAKTLAMAGAEVEFTAYATNSLFEPVGLPGAVSYSVDGSNGTVSSEGYLTLSETASDVVKVTASSAGLTAEAEVEIIKDITYTPSVTSLNMNPGESKDINVSVYFGYAPVNAKDSLFTWTCDANIGTIDENGVFTAGATPAENGNIYVEYGEQKKIIPVSVGGEKPSFEDVSSHWAKDYIEELLLRGIVNGMSATEYQPDGQLTRAQFLTMLAGCSGDDFSQAAASGFSDVNDGHWFYNYVNWGVENGIVSGMDENTFAPNNNITREQMAVMLSKYAALKEIELKDIQSPSFTDNEKISSWSAEAVGQIVRAGIMSGRPEGNFDPQGPATRAEAATVVYKLVVQ